MEAHPLFWSELGRVTKAVSEKYPLLTVVDIGANVGFTSAVLRSCVDAPIICIEGDEQAFSLLKENTQQIPNITLRKVFLGERTEKISVVIENYGFNASLLPSSAPDAGTVELVSFDDFFADDRNVAQYKLLKIDTEGFDTTILRGAAQFLKEVKPVLFFEYNRHCMMRLAEDGLATLMSLERIGYSEVLFYESTGRFILSGNLADHKLIRQIHAYADGFNASMEYVDICAFHETDADIAGTFVRSEEEFRLANSGFPGTDR